MSIVLTEHSYGKTRIRLTKVTRRADRHDIRELTIEIRLEGDFDASYTAGDNRSIIPTDTMKNVVYAMAGEHTLDSIEGFGLALAGHFVEHHGHVERATARLVEHPLERIRGRGRRASPRLRRPGRSRRGRAPSGAAATACTSSRASPTCSCSRRRIRRSPVSSATVTRRCPTAPTASSPRCSRPTGSPRSTSRAIRLERRTCRGAPRPDRDLRRPPQPFASSRRSTRWAPPCSPRAPGSSGSP